MGYCQQNHFVYFVVAFLLRELTCLAFGASVGVSWAAACAVTRPLRRAGTWEPVVSSAGAAATESAMLSSALSDNQLCRNAAASKRT